LDLKFQKRTWGSRIAFHRNIKEYWGAWLAQSVEHTTLDLGVVSSSPTLGVEVT